MRFACPRQGDIIGFVDAGIELNRMAFLCFWNIYEYDADIVIGSKRHRRQSLLSLAKKILSFGYQIITKIPLD